MEDNPTPAMEPFVNEMLADFDNRDEADREKIKAIRQQRIRERSGREIPYPTSVCARHFGRGPAGHRPGRMATDNGRDAEDR